MCTDTIKISNQIMETIWRINRSSNGVSYDEREELRAVWSQLTLANKDYFRVWARHNDFKLPDFLEVNHDV